jgi:hypothetical protein
MIIDRYTSAINTSNLKSDPRTTYSPSDVLGAMGLASKHYPLGAALQRLFVDGMVTQCVEILAGMARTKSFKLRVKLRPTQYQQIAEKTLAWYRHGTCTECGGTGKEVVMEPRPHLSENDCPNCSGTGRRPFEPNFCKETLEIALWLKNEIERQQAMAGRAAMVAIAPMLEL